MDILWSPALPLATIVFARVPDGLAPRPSPLPAMHDRVRAAIDHDSDVPVYVQLAEILRGQIDRGAVTVTAARVRLGSPVPVSLGPAFTTPAGVAIGEQQVTTVPAALRRTGHHREHPCGGMEPARQELPRGDTIRRERERG
jgi:hypothetical protein